MVSLACDKYMLFDNMIVYKDVFVERMSAIHKYYDSIVISNDNNVI